MFSGTENEIVAGPGDEISLSCPINTQGKQCILEGAHIIMISYLECGPYHSLKWYHEGTRVYVYSPVALFKNAEGALMNRWCKFTSKMYEAHIVFLIE